MGFFSRFNAPRVPRWAFKTGWADFVAALAEEASRYAVRVDDAHLVTGLVPLPHPAPFETWDIRPLATRCRELEPYEWLAAIRESLFEVFGHAGDVELVDTPPLSARTRAAPPSRPAKPRAVLAEHLRLQIFGRDYIAAIKLDTSGVAMRPFGDAWLGVVEDLGGAAEATVRWTDLDAAGIGREDAFELARANAVADTTPHVVIETLVMTGARCELAVANSFYLGAVMLETHARLPDHLAIVACALTWHHWVFATLDHQATRATLAELHALVATLATNVTVQAAEWIGTSLWWWPPGGPPEVVTLDGRLPPGLAAVIE